MHFNGLASKGQEIPREENFLYHNHCYSAVKIRAATHLGKAVRR